MLIALHKPYGMMSQFTEELPGQRTLAELRLPPGVYPIGRLDQDSEGLLLLSDEPALVDRLLNPKQAHPRTYLAQVERVPAEETLRELERGVMVQGKRTLPCRARLLNPQPQIPPRDPPIRVRREIPDAWISLTLVEGRNRQVRRMTAAVGHPTLRLLRIQIGGFPLGELAAGTWKILDAQDREQVLQRQPL
jgi:23S rRNA pseudouridine2457 synthase